MATPALVALRKAFPKAKIVLLAKQHAQELIRESHLVDEVIIYDFPWTAFRGKYRLWRYRFRDLVSLVLRLRREQFDLAIDARMDIRNKFLLFLSGARRRVGYDYAGGAYFLTDAVPIDASRPHRVDEWLRLLEYSGIPAKDERPTLCLTMEERRQVESMVKVQGIESEDLVIGIHPGARIPVRRWDLQKFAILGDILAGRYGAKILVFVDPDGYGADVPMKTKPTLIRSSLRELMAFIERCDLMVCNDSGPMHIAVGLGTPVVAVFGPTEPESFGPYGESQRVVIQDGLPCRPCFDRCRFDQPYCITTITVEQVLSVVKEQLAAGSRETADHIDGSLAG
jgi:ADP-heptose:LPS heptosyltransferase